MATETVDLAIHNGDFYSYVSLPEGILLQDILKGNKHYLVGGFIPSEKYYSLLLFIGKPIYYGK